MNIKSLDKLVEQIIASGIPTIEAHGAKEYVELSFTYAGMLINIKLDYDAMEEAVKGIRKGIEIIIQEVQQMVQEAQK